MRPISLPRRNSPSVGMLLMPYCAPSSGDASVSSFTNRTPGHRAAAFWNSGAIIRQGPHHGAQKYGDRRVGSGDAIFGAAAGADDSHVHCNLAVRNSVTPVQNVSGTL